MIVYFSGTGNSRLLARELAQKLEDQAVDMFDSIRSQGSLSLHSEKPWIVVSPTYAWQLPHVVRDLIRRSTFTGNENVYFVMTCGSDIGGAGRYNRMLAEEKHLRYRGTLEVKMPENYIALFDVPEPRAARALIVMGRRKVRKSAELIREGKNFPEKQGGPLDWIKSCPVNPAFYGMVVKAKPFYSKDACIGCGKCAAVCPLGNISLRDGRPQWGRDCTHCMACISSCPVEAIEYGKASLGKIRYRCEAYSGSEE